MKNRNQSWRQVERRTRALLERAGQLLGVEVPRVEIRFDLKGLAAGQVRLPQAAPPVIRYNPKLLENNAEAFLQQTVPHEVAHVMVARRYRQKVRPHGPQWQSLMRRLGAEPKRCHDFDTSRSQGRRMARFTYYCGCRSHQISAVRNNRIAAGQSYICRSCGEQLRASEP